jgi:transcriptional regulator with GAF, ATPase, and Fis domain
MQTTDGKYRTLLELTTAIDKETNVQTILKSLHKPLSAILRFDGIAMLLLTGDEESLRLVALERGLAGPHVEVGAEGPYAGSAAGRAIEEQRTIYVPDTRQEMTRFFQTASQASASHLRSSYMVPVSTPRRKLGVLWFGTRKESAAGPDDVALMEAVAFHVATALESVERCSRVISETIAGRARPLEVAARDQQPCDRVS